MVVEDHNFPLSYVESEAITINDDTDFITQGWPGNGTSEDPFIIANLQIESETLCIAISFTTSHFIIRDCILLGQSTGIAISLSNLSNAIVDSNILDQAINGISLIHTSNMTIRNNVVSNTEIGGASIAGWHNQNLTVDNNEIFDGGFWVEGIALNYLNTSNISNNFLHDNLGFGIRILQGYDTNIHNNTLVGPASYANGITVDSGSDCIINMNWVGGYEVGISVNGEFLSIANNTLVFNQYGVEVLNSRLAMICDNTISDQYIEGIHSSNSSTLSIIGNTIRNSYTGIGLFGVHTSTIENNQIFNNVLGIRIADYITPIDEILRDTTTNCWFINNELHNNGFVFESDFLSGWVHEFSGNYIDSQEFGYFQNRVNATINCNKYGQLVAVNSNHLSFVEGTITNVNIGVSIAFCTDVNVSRFIVSQAMIGFYVYSSIIVRITDCVTTDNILGENYLGLQYSGLLIDKTESCTVINTFISHSENGILILNSSYCGISNNSILYNQIGISAVNLGASIISFNSISENLDIGILIDDKCTEIRIFGNIIHSNLQNALCYSESAYWDDGNSIGNNWSDFDGGEVYVVSPYGRDNFPDQVVESVTIEPDEPINLEPAFFPSLITSFLFVISIIATRDFRSNY